MPIADELLADARRIFDLEAESKRVNSELACAKAEYNAKIAKLTNGDAVMLINQIQRNGNRNGGSNGPVEGPLRNQILALLRGSRSPITLDEIQEKVEERRAKILWTLANLKRAGLAHNPKRGFWMRGEADEEDGRNDPDDPETEPEITF
jgi:DNA-binding transcriptional ArsR family regulator